MSPPSIRAACLVGLVYFIVGTAFASLAGAAGPGAMRTAVRMSAWAISAIVFLEHVRRERFRVGDSSRKAALAAALAVALAGFGLAVVANVRAMTASPPHPSIGLKLSLGIWPIMLGIPAFVFAWMFAAVIRPRPSAELS